MQYWDQSRSKLNAFTALQCRHTGLIQKYQNNFMSNALIYIGIAVGVAAMAGAIAYGTENQKNYIQEDAVLSQAAE